MGSKRVPNRIINNEGHLGGYQSALEGILASPERSLAAIYGFRGDTSEVGKMKAEGALPSLGVGTPP